MAMRGAILVLAVGFVALLFNGGSRFTMGLMLKPMADDLDWARTTLSLAVTFFMIVSALALPVAGRLVDRFNTRTVLAAAMLAAGASIAMMRFIETPLEMLILYGVVFALASAGTSITPHRGCCSAAGSLTGSARPTAWRSPAWVSVSC
ncbi:MAG: MFS transporter [Gammaproteobacteria bacterium]|nr:MFS transporter [Gammaproteobacteria bacterium]